jgi:ElaB/YqjD/DUF883 family membrane-anchored ribosome-binding protein
MFNRIAEFAENSSTQSLEAAKSAWDQSGRRAKEAIRQLERSIADNPAAALAVAFAAGVCVAWWLKRR